MILITDNDVQNSLGDWLRNRGQDARRVREVLSEGASDPSIIEYARTEYGIIVTHNYNHFLNLANKVLSGGDDRHRTWGLLCLCCSNHKEGERRVQYLWDIIEENRRALLRHPSGLLLHMDIHPLKYSIHY
ncbi:MAG: DUF5615 family PIN-like protein [Chloroflexota bacterium]